MKSKRPITKYGLNDLDNIQYKYQVNPRQSKLICFQFFDEGPERWLSSSTARKEENFLNTSIDSTPKLCEVSFLHFLYRDSENHK